MAPYYETAKVSACSTCAFIPAVPKHVHNHDNLRSLTIPNSVLEQSFVDVEVTDDGVRTASFLQASDDFVNMFDLLGTGVFSFVQTDLRSNIAGVRARHEQKPNESVTLEQLVVKEAEEGQRHATACLVRLVRGLLFTCRALENMQEDRNAELHVCFRRSYDAILKHHHSFIVRSVVTVAIRAVPHRHVFYDRLTEGTSHEKFDVELVKWLAGLEAIVTRLRNFLEEGGYGRV
ncbi:glycolipid transfer protein [Irpex rosettiformis]|uniref:Glycolipid transfer protein n=1 Tax=Irpex rosettiformis TaxID=378272 RepID=A0ACB8TUN0_9APHY|nr:glycolipid transfer protein [Irpex rosettiformis]